LAGPLTCLTEQGKIIRISHRSVVLMARHAFGVDELVPQCGERCVVELESELQGPVRHPLTPLEEFADLS
jgi:erythromycin esterase-like protein